MDKPDLNPLIIMLLYIVRCLVPLGIMLGVSYVLRRLGLISKPASPPKDWNDNQNNNNGTSEGGLAHG
ncbi:MAG: hypothetical protein H6Q38_2434 [Chloroflexi bacterium]|jgi:hypothetical protein|nr:hypothetical protein [Chloroflexota bacterium]